MITYNNEHIDKIDRIFKGDKELDYVLNQHYQIFPKGAVINDVHIDVDFAKTYTDSAQITGNVGNDVVRSILEAVDLVEGKYLGDGKMAYVRLYYRPDFGNGWDKNDRLIYYPDGTSFSPEMPIDTFYKLPPIHAKCTRDGTKQHFQCGLGYVKDISFMNFGHNELLGSRQGWDDHNGKDTFISIIDGGKNAWTYSYGDFHNLCAARGEGYQGGMYKFRNILTWLHLMCTGKWITTDTGDYIYYAFNSIFKRCPGIDRLWYNDNTSMQEWVDNMIIIDGILYETDSDGYTPVRRICEIPHNNSGVMGAFPTSFVPGGTFCDIAPALDIQGIQSTPHSSWSNYNGGRPSHVKACAATNGNIKNEIITYSFDPADDQSNKFHSRLCFKGELIDMTDNFEEFKKLPYINNPYMKGHLDPA